MKKILTYFIAGAAIAAVSIACNKPKNPDVFEQGEDVPFSVCSSDDAISDEQIPYLRISPEPFDTPWGEGKIIVVNSNEELEKHIEEDLPDIDFSTNTLLLVGGGSSSSPVKVEVLGFQRLSESNYELEIEIEQGFATFGSGWRIGILTGKMPSRNEIKLNIITIDE